MKVKFSLFTLLFSVTAISQEIIFDDQFNDDKNAWTQSDGNCQTSIKNGELIVASKDKQSSVWNLKTIDFNPDEVDFDIETAIKVVVAPSNNSSYDLIWSGYSDDSQFNGFRIACFGSFQLFQFQKTDAYIYQDWKTDNALLHVKKYNKLNITKRANIVRYYINDQLVYQSGENGYYGNKVGFLLDPLVTISVDYLTIRSYPKKIAVVDSFDPDLTIVKLPETVNSPYYTETNPVVSADGTIMYLIRKGAPENTGSSAMDDIWMTSKDINGNWTALRNVGRPLNNEGHNFVVSMSPDNNTLLIGNTYNIDGGVYGPGVSITSKTMEGWHIPYIMDIDQYQNKNEFVSYFLSPDNKFLLISVETDYGYGEKDLYVCTRKGDYAWSQPKNLGKTLNTFDAEINPFLAADGKTLYFSSRGHKGYGNFDLFVAKRLDDTWTNWSEPQNLGNVINSPFDELGIFLSAKGDKAYLASAGDIYEIDNTVKQDPVVLVKGKVYDAKTKEILTAPIVYNDLKSNSELGTAISDPKTGAYSIVLPFGNAYSFMAEKAGYYALTENIDLKDLKEYKEITVDLYLNPIEKGQTIRLNNVFFESNKYDLLPESYAELENLYEVLIQNKNLKINIAGHTDAVGNEASNMTLSNNRAQAVMNYLVQKGIDKSRLSAQGFGETKFISDNETEEGRQLNRRVEFSILEL